MGACQDKRRMREALAKRRAEALLQAEQDKKYAQLKTGTLIQKSTS